MRRFYSFLLMLFFASSLLLLFGFFSAKDCRKQCDNAAVEWRKGQDRLADINHFSAENAPIPHHLLHEAIFHFDKAYGLYEEILSDIRRQRDHGKKRAWQMAEEIACKAERDASLSLRDNLMACLLALEHKERIEHASNLWAESLKKYELAESKKHTLSYNLKDEHALSKTLGEISYLYEEAANLAQRARDHAKDAFDDESKNVLQVERQRFLGLAAHYQKEKKSLPAVFLEQKNSFKKELENLEEEASYLKLQGSFRKLLEVLKKREAILSQLVDCNEANSADLIDLKKQIEEAEEEVVFKRLTGSFPLLSFEEFSSREKERRRLFFLSNQLFPYKIFPLNEPLPCVTPLDPILKLKPKESNFTLYTESYSRFKLQTATTPSSLVIKVYKEGVIVHEEKVAIPVKHSLAWDRHLLDEGRILTPKIAKEQPFGLDLRISIIPAGTLRGAALMGLGSAVSATGIGALVGVPTMVYGGVTVAYNMDNAIAGMSTAFSGEYVDTASVQLLESTGISSGHAAVVDGVVGTMLDMGTSRLVKGANHAGSKFVSSSAKVAVKETITAESVFLKALKHPRFQGFTQNNYRKYFKLFTGTDPGKHIDAHHVFPQNHLDYFIDCGVNIHDPKYLSWREGVSHRMNAIGYDTRWKAFRKTNPTPTVEQVEQFGKEVMSEYRIPIYY